MSRVATAVLAAALALAAPAGALAQSAGDDQYRDPFAEENPAQQDDSGGGGGGDGTPSPAPAPAPAPSTGATPTEPTATTAATLPRTGLGAGWVTAAGLGLMAAGAGLRRSVRA